MSKGIFIMILAGFGFMYMVTNFVGQAESTTPGLENSQSRKAKDHAQYYTQDVNGDDVLNFAGAPLAKAKAVWAESTVKHRVMGYFPDFDTMKQIAEGQLDDSEFRAYLLDHIKKTEGGYIDGVLSLEQTKKALEGIK
ncbi:MAG: hypothetical protein HF962_00795 [Sulfurovum sp.]|nr:hypothetical protein [Sulfurovum sp.]